MAVDATGTPSTNFDFPKYNPDVDAPSGLGLNAVVDDIDSKLFTKFVHSEAAGLAADEVPVWNGTSWVYQKVNTNQLEDSAVTAAKVAASAIDNSKVAAGAAISVSKLAAGSNGQVLTTSGGTPTWSAPTSDTRYRLTGDVDVTNTTIETDLISQSIGAGVMGTDKLLRATIIGDLLNNSGTRTLTLRIKFGGTTIYAAGLTTPSIADADRKGFIFDILIGNKGAANVQFGSFRLMMDDMGADDPAPTTGVGIWHNAAFTGNPVATNGNIAVDTALAQTLAVTAQWDFATATVSLRKKYALIEVV